MKHPNATAAEAAAETFGAGVTRPPEPASALDLTDYTAAAVAEPAAAMLLTSVAGMQIPATEVTNSPKTASGGLAAANQPL